MADPVNVADAVNTANAADVAKWFSPATSLLRIFVTKHKYPTASFRKSKVMDADCAKEKSSMVSKIALMMKKISPHPNPVSKRCSPKGH